MKMCLLGAPFVQSVAVKCEQHVAVAATIIIAAIVFSVMAAMTTLFDSLKKYC